MALLNLEGELLNLFPTYQLESGPQTNYGELLCYMKVMRKSQVEGESVMGVGEMNLKGAGYLGRLLSPKVHRRHVSIAGFQRIGLRLLRAPRRTRAFRNHRSDQRMAAQSQI